MTLPSHLRYVLTLPELCSNSYIEESDTRIVC